MGEGWNQSRALPWVLGPSGSYRWRSQLSPRPPALGANVPHDYPCLRPSPIRGAFRIQWRCRLEGWVSGGAGLVLESWALLPAAGPACALLHRAGAQQGSEGAIRWGTTTLHFEVGSQGGILA